MPQGLSRRGDSNARTRRFAADRRQLTADSGGFRKRPTRPVTAGVAAGYSRSYNEDRGVGPPAARAAGSRPFGFLVPAGGVDGVEMALQTAVAASLLPASRSQRRDAVQGAPVSFSSTRVTPAFARWLAAAACRTAHAAAARRAAGALLAAGGPAGHRAGRLVRRALPGAAGLHSGSAAGPLGSRRSSRARQSRRWLSSGPGPRLTTPGRSASGSVPSSPGAASSSTSGLARGVDSAAHAGCLRRGGRYGCRPRLRPGSGLPGGARGSRRQVFLNKGLWSASWALARHRCQSTSRSGTVSSAGSPWPSSSSKPPKRAGR